MSGRLGDGETGQPTAPEAVEALGPDWTAGERLILLHLATAKHPQTPAEIGDGIGYSTSGVWSLASPLADDGWLERETVETPGRGPDKTAFRLASSTAAELGLGEETDDIEPAVLQERVVRELATIHWQKHLSTAKSSQIASRIQGVTGSRVAKCMQRLEQQDIVECPERPSSTHAMRWRLVGADRHAPFRAPGTTASEEVSQ